ncbi:MAG: dTDP-4-dehydrorhamnose 3,5-epimerase [Proteobacteria bacterium]|nr:dTDP-4-dehydrorhamnose 3,5-epimerase [Pseudomonadota bacterium]
MKFIPTELPGVIVIEPDVHGDERGFLLETYHQARYAEGGVDAIFVQDNHSRSGKGALRGIHAQIRRPQGKLVRVVEGEVFDVALDIRRGAPTYGRHFSTLLSAENFRQLYIPPGFAHGFCVTTEVAQFEYKCTDFYDPGGEISIAWNDPDLGIRWPLPEPVLSDKDRNARRLRDFSDDELPRYGGETRS